MIELYTAATANGRRATLMLEECGLSYRAHVVTLGAGLAAKPAELVALNPRGTIPVIVDPDGPGGRRIVLSQSGAILLYLAEKTGKLLPQEPEARARAEEWMMQALTDLAPASSGAFYATTMPEGKGQAMLEFFEPRLVESCAIVDRRLGEAPYLAGDALSIADVALYPVVVRRQALIDKVPGLANLKRWAAALAARPAVKRALMVAA